MHSLHPSHLHATCTNIFLKSTDVFSARFRKEHTILLPLFHVIAVGESRSVGERKRKNIEEELKNVLVFL
jgi:hypothetical protein